MGARFAALDGWEFPLDVPLSGQPTASGFLLDSPGRSVRGGEAAG
jgi:hypothetical protein